MKHRQPGLTERIAAGILFGLLGLLTGPIDAFILFAGILYYRFQSLKGITRKLLYSLPYFLEFLLSFAIYAIISPILSGYGSLTNGLTFGFNCEEAAKLTEKTYNFITKAAKKKTPQFKYKNCSWLSRLLGSIVGLCIGFLCAPFIALLNCILVGYDELKAMRWKDRLIKFPIFLINLPFSLVVSLISSFLILPIGGIDAGFSGGLLKAFTLPKFLTKKEIKMHHWQQFALKKIYQAEDEASNARLDKQPLLDEVHSSSYEQLLKDKYQHRKDKLVILSSQTEKPTSCIQYIYKLFAPRTIKEEKITQINSKIEKMERKHSWLKKMDAA